MTSLSGSAGSTSAVERAGFAADRVFRLTSFALAIAGLVLLVLNLPGALGQADVLTPVWTISSVAAVALPPIFAIAFANTARASQLRWLWGIEALVLLLAYATVPLARGGVSIPASTGMPWLILLSVLAGCAATVAWRIRWVILYAVGLEASLFGLSLFVAEPFPSGALGDAVGQFFFSTFFICLGVALRRAGKLLDETVAMAVAEAEDASAADLRRSARQRVEMLIHDSVIVALFVYTGAGQPAQAVGEAQRALAAISAARSSRTEIVERAPRALAWELQAIVTQLDPAAVFDYSLAGTIPVPADAADAIIEASSEALRNSVRHSPADRLLARQVRVDITDSAIEVLVLDDGEGFDATTVNPARMGIRSGIVGRLRAVAGGEAIVSSRIGYGTTVVVRWRRP
jgi:signal transduction histidine kinase